MQTTRTRLEELFAGSPVLMITAAAMVLDLLVCVVGLMTDHTVITGLPAWIKPAKFAISTGIYALSLVVIIRYTRIWKRTLRITEVLIGAALMLEIVLIDLQAARHTTSHFNVATPFDKAVWITMGTSIGVFWFASILVAIATFRTQYVSGSWTIAVRYGMLLAVVGTGTGIFMAVPSNAQIQTAHKTHHMNIAGSHTIGGIDGGKGLPVLGWSTQNGDVRVAHFVGLHGLQVFAILAFLLDRRRVLQAKAARIVSVAVLSCGSFFIITLIEALLKRPITDHDAVLTTIWALWAALSVALFWFVTRNRVGNRRPAKSQAAGGVA